jgi:signal transduction histidine kinase
MAFAYALLAGTWVTLAIHAEPRQGLSFVAVTALLLYFERRQAEERKAALHLAEHRLLAELEAQLAERTRALERSRRELEDFTYSVSHDLRAPLRAVEGFSRALLEDHGPGLDATGHEYAERLADSARRMEDLIRDLVAYSRLGRDELPSTDVDLGPVVADALAQLGAQVSARGARVALEKPLPRVFGHHATLVLMVLNLLENALKFVARDTRPEIRVYAETRGERVRLTVEDKGIGVAHEHHEQIFHPLERLHGAETYPGTGMGLGLVRRGAERLGGTAGVASVVGEGSRFWIELAAHAPPAR